MKSYFAQRLVDWQRQYGRHHLPWQTRNPYHVWLSEIMLQQTQVVTVLAYYPKFLAAFPCVEDLANASLDEVLSLWAGLGYYSRAKNLHRAAQQIVHEFGGVFPSEREQLEQLYGVGRSTAAAIAAFAFHQRETILDGNVKRVLCRVFAQDGELNDKAFERSLWQLAESLLPSASEDMPAYIQGLMDLGATVCQRSKPLCEQCPMSSMCLAKQQNRIAQLPRKKAAVKAQQVSLYWLVLRGADGIVLHKRPNKGIWSGLYCVPCFTELSNLYEFAQTLGVRSEDIQEQRSFTHRLTHRLLEIIPFEAVLPSASREQLAEQGLLCTQPTQYGLPKPLQNYLQQQHIRFD